MHLLTSRRKDLKAAMIAKDTNRLAVLRSLLSSTLNASKTSSPINTDMQMLALLKKTATQSKASADEFRAAGRNDLAEKEDNQIKVLEEYAGEVETIGPEEIASTVKSVIEKLKGEAAGKKLQMGDVLKTIFSPDVLGGKPVEKAEVAKAVKQAMAES